MKKLVADDPDNYTPIYVEVGDNCVFIYDESFGEPDVYKMICMSKDQFRKLQKVKV